MDSLKAQEIYSYHVNDIKSIFENDKTLVVDKDIDSLIDRTKLENGKFTGIGKDKNLIVIQVEALDDGSELSPEEAAKQAKNARPKPELLEEECPECKKPLVKRKNRRGEYFIGCSGFPKCRYLRNIEEDEDSDKTEENTSEQEDDVNNEG